MNPKYKVLISIILISIYTVSPVSASEIITVTGNIGTGVEGCKNLKGDDGKVYYLIYNKNLPPDGTHVTITGTMVNPGMNFCMVGDMLQVSSISCQSPLIDNNPITRKIVTKTCNNCDPNIYQLHTDGTIWKYTGTPITGWLLLDNNFMTAIIAGTEGYLYQLHFDGTIWQYTGSPWWKQLDDHQSTISIVAGGNYLYQLRSNGEIWKYVNFD